MKKKQGRAMWGKRLILLTVVLALAVAGGGCLFGVQEAMAPDGGEAASEAEPISGEESDSWEESGTALPETADETTDPGDVAGETAESDFSAGGTERETEQERWADVIAKADLMALQYNYEGAILLLEEQETYASSELLQEKTAQYRAQREACIEVKPEEVAHVFTHSLIVDPVRAFDEDRKAADYNRDMLTVEEFRKILQSMYDNGYVLVSLHDIGEIDENGIMQPKSIWLPEGKKALVFSYDDVSYYHVYENDGFADCLFVDENGEVKSRYTDAEGNVLVGDYDMVPIVDSFVREHPDFSYHGRKGIVALTGYNGVFGYRTDTDYRDWAYLQEDQRLWLETHPEYDYEAEVEAAKAVADAMRANGWEFASHTWGHISMKTCDMGLLQRDTVKWQERVAPIVGDTDIIIYAYGADIGGTTPYSSGNEKFVYLKDAGFDYFCNVDGTTLRWVLFGENYLRQSRMNLDGQRMAEDPEILAELFDVEEVYDPSRPSA